MRTFSYYENFYNVNFLPPELSSVLFYSQPEGEGDGRVIISSKPLSGIQRRQEARCNA